MVHSLKLSYVLAEGTSSLTHFMTMVVSLFITACRGEEQSTDGLKSSHLASQYTPIAVVP